MSSSARDRVMGAEIASREGGGGRRLVREVGWEVVGWLAEWASGLGIALSEIR